MGNESNGSSLLDIAGKLSKFLSLKTKLIILGIIIFLVIIFAVYSMISSFFSSSSDSTTKVSYYMEDAIFPLPVCDTTITITSVYGYRICPFHGREIHGGIDLVGADGSNIIAVADGEVVVSMYSTSYGNTVVIKHNDEETKTVYTRYAHMKYTPNVSVGDEVIQGTILGYQGSTRKCNRFALTFRSICRWLCLK